MITDLKVKYSIDEFKDLLEHIPEENKRWNKGYKTWIILDTEGQPNLYEYSSLDDCWMYMYQYIVSEFDRYKNNNEYLKVKYIKPNGWIVEETVHRLTHYAWTGESTGHKHGVEIDHIDGNKFNNNPSNLRIVVHKDNCNNPNKTNPTIRAQQLAKCYNNNHTVELL